MGIFRTREEKLAKLKNRLERKGKSPEVVKRRLEVRSNLLDVGQGVGSFIAQNANIALSAVPFGGVAGKVLSKVPGLGDQMPIVKEIAKVGEIQFDAKVKEYGGPLQAIMADAMPLLEDIREGDWKTVVLSLAVIAGAVGVYFLL